MRLFFPDDLPGIVAQIQRRLETIPESVWSGTLLCIGTGLLVLHVYHLTLAVSPIALLIGIVIPAVLSLVVVGVGIWLHRGADRIHGPVMTAWMVLAMAWMVVAGAGAVLYEATTIWGFTDKVYLIAIFGTYGSVPGLITGWYDASRQRQLEIVSDREEQLRILSRILRHNVRNEMNVILGRAEEINENTDGSVKDHSAEILRSGDQLLSLTEKEHRWVESLLDPSERTVVAVDRVLGSVANELREQYPNAEISIPEIECRVRALPQIELVLRELIENGIIHNDADPPRVTVAVERREQTVSLTVTDNGPGLPTEEIAVVRERTPRTPLHHASSLGLQLATHVVDQSRGSITFERLEDRGTRVTLEFVRGTVSSS